MKRLLTLSCDFLLVSICPLILAFPFIGWPAWEKYVLSLCCGLPPVTLNINVRLAPSLWKCLGANIVSTGWCIFLVIFVARPLWV